MSGRSRYSRRMAHKLALPPRPPPNYGSVNCGACGRMVPAIDARGSYLCTCGKGHYADVAVGTVTSA